MPEHRKNVSSCRSMITPAAIPDRITELRAGVEGDADLLLRETNHRFANDLQLVVSLLSLQSRNAASPEARDALDDATRRVSVLARARADLASQDPSDLQTALRQVCEALHAQAEPRSILVSMRAEHEVSGLSPMQIMTVALAVNELATNAIKHAFAERNSGRVAITMRRNGDREAVVVVDDDGLPFPELDGSRSRGMGLELVKRLVASIGGLVILPSEGTKMFEITVPLATA